ncbi:hypothetical protein IPA_00945 [Ignicoccus pacificus DSM 13166]|uniref:NurA domain-containing protein n=1 Tax=Ignicoccus pacificus DSM 13166 TaxID=940294 RepID=A0A977PL72_9CREN|nr:hypothetical protein IPA_00945 [Ignicoccus pacificus DSM 13166]
MDVFVDLFLEKIRIRGSDLKFNAKIPLRPLPKGEEVEQAGVDGGGGVLKLEGGKVLYIARAVAVSSDGMIRDMIVEVNPWESKPLLESMRSYVELSAASRVKDKELLMDGSYYTVVVRWLQRVARVALMKAKTSEILSLPYTLLALEKLVDIVKKKPIFVAKSPRFKVFKDYLILKELYERTGYEKFYFLMKSPELDKKELIPYLRDPNARDLVQVLLSAAISDVDMIEGEGYTFGLELGLPRKIRRILSPSMIREIVQMARENYEMTTGEEAPRVNLEELCYLKSPVLWWVSTGRVKFTVEEASGQPLCISSVRREIDAAPSALPHLVAHEYNPWLALAHTISTLKGEQLMVYAQLLKARLGIGMEVIREDLLSTSRSR